MKRLIALLLALMMVFTLCACGEDPVSPDPIEQPVEDPKPVEDPVEPDPAPVEPVEPNVPEQGLKILYEQDDSMINTYSVIAVNENAPFVDADGNSVSDVYINTVGAEALINWLLSETGAELISSFGFEDYGEYLFYNKEDRPVSSAEIPAATEETRTIRLSTTTSVNDSGLLGYLLPIFEQEYGYKVEVASAGTGKAIAAATYGNADLILVHSKSQEETFIEGGYGKVLDGFDAERLSFMYNYFVLIGPEADPAGAALAANVKDAFKLIADGKYTFISRGDKSGTHTKELSLWASELGITAEAESFAAYTEWYTSANAGMGVCLSMANEMGGYILSDKATFLAFDAAGGILE